MNPPDIEWSYSGCIKHRLGIGLDRKAPVTSLNPMLCTVSIILSAEALAFMNKNELYSSLDKMSALYIYNKLDE